MPRDEVIPAGRRGLSRRAALSLGAAALATPML